MVSGFGMECWGLRMWGSLERWVRVRVTGGDGSPRTNLIQMDLRTDGGCLFTTVFLVYVVLRHVVNKLVTRLNSKVYLNKKN